jgi:hypothetical protein
VLPSWNNRLYITLSPERISLHLWGRGLRPKLLTELDVVIESSAVASSQSTQAIVDKLNQLLAKPEWQNAEVGIVLSNRLVRYAVIPFDAQLKKYAEQEAYAKHALRKIYGAVVAQWEIRIQHSNSALPKLISAVDKTLLENVRHVCTIHKLKLRSITPQLLQAINRHAQDIKSNPAWLVMNEPSYTLFALLKNGELPYVSGVNNGNIKELPVLLDRENLSATLDEPCKSVYLYGSAEINLTSLPKSTYEISKLITIEQEGMSNPVDVVLALFKRRSHKLAMNYQMAVDLPSKRAGWLLLVVGLAILFEMGITYNRLQNDRTAMDRDIKTSKLHIDDGSRTVVTGQYTDKDIADASLIIKRLSTPWNHIFVGMESVSNKNVAILAIAPDVQTGLLRLEGEAKDYAAALTLVAQLRATKPFSDVFLLNHETKRDDPQHPIRFTLSLRWVNQS